MQRRYVMAIDAGGSATRCAVADFEGNLLGFGAVDGREAGSPHPVADPAAIIAAAHAALAAAGSEVPSVDIVVAGSAAVGVDGAGAAPIEDALASVAPRAGRVRVVPDMVIAFWGALALPVGVVVSAGMGSVCYGRNVTGETCQVGGWGPLLGDEGSAYDISRHALRAVARAADGRGRPTLLTELLTRAVGVNTTVELSRLLAADATSRRDIAALAVQVAAAARQRDPVALRLFQRAGTDLAIAAVAALRQLNLLETPVSVSFSGSVFEAGRTLTQSFTNSLQDATPLARVEAPLLPPIGGAFRLGLQGLGFAMDESIIYRFAKGLVRSGL